MKNHADALIVSNSEQVRCAICAGATNCIYHSRKAAYADFSARCLKCPVGHLKIRSGMEG